MNRTHPYESDGLRQASAVLWYHPREISEFRRQARDTAAAHWQATAGRTTTTTTLSVDKNNKDDNMKCPHYLWTQNMETAYRKFCQIKESDVDIRQDDDDDDDANGSCATVITATTATDMLGLERRVIPSILQDTKIRRKYLMGQIMRWQYSSSYQHHHYHDDVNDVNDDTESRRRFLAEVSRRCSYPSRLYAHHVAALSAVTDNNDEERETCT